MKADQHVPISLVRLLCKHLEKGSQRRVLWRREEPSDLPLKTPGLPHLLVCCNGALQYGGRSLCETGHKAQLPSGEAVAVAVPYASCVIFQLLSPFVATAVVLLSCCRKFSRLAVVFFFFPSGFFHLPAVWRDVWHGCYTRTCRQFPLRQHTGAGLLFEEENKGGREGRGCVRLLPRTKSQNIQGLCCETGNSPHGSFHTNFTPLTMIPIISRHMLLSLCGTRCWGGRPALCSHQDQLGRTITACRVLRATALLRAWLWPVLSGCDLEGVWQSMARKGYMCS